MRTLSLSVVRAFSSIDMSISARGVVVHGHSVSYDLVCMILAVFVLMLTLLIRCTFRRNKPLNASARPQLPPPTNNTAPVGPSMPLPDDAPRVRLSRGGRYTAIILTLAGLTFWAIRHVYTTAEILQGRYHGQFGYAYAFIFAVLVVQLLLAYYERPKKGNSVDGNAIDHHNVVVVIPVYNEDLTILRNTLVSTLTSSRRPNVVSVMDDGSTELDYTGLQNWFTDLAATYHVRVHWQRTVVNQGKRHAQMEALNVVPDATVVITMDSDGVLDHKAIEEILKPFADPKVRSVAGTVLATNNQANLFARFNDNMFVTQQLTDRSAMSAVGQVLVNSGGLAAYRAEVFYENRDTYLNETFGGVPIKFSDDSLACLFALMGGKTVHQPTAFVFCTMPQTFDQHRRQQLRWLRGSFIRSWWRLRYLPLLSWGFLRQAVGWMQLIMSTYILGVLLIVNPLLGHGLPWEVVAVPLAVGYGQALRYWSFKRSDMSFWSHLLNYLLTPVANVWSFLFLRPLRFYAMFTCRKSKWNTRGKIEVAGKTAEVSPGRHAAITIGEPTANPLNQPARGNERERA